MQAALSAPIFEGSSATVLQRAPQPPRLLMRCQCEDCPPLAQTLDHCCSCSLNSRFPPPMQPVRSPTTNCLLHVQDVLLAFRISSPPCSARAGMQVTDYLHRSRLTHPRLVATHVGLRTSLLVQLHKMGRVLQEADCCCWRLPRAHSDPAPARKSRRCAALRTHCLP